MTKVTEADLAICIVGYFLSRKMTVEEVEREIKAAKEIILSGSAITLEVLNRRLKEIDNSFVEFNKQTFAQLCTFMHSFCGLQFDCLDTK